MASGYSIKVSGSVLPRVKLASAPVLSVAPESDKAYIW